ncbi:HNH endonuclease [Solimonas marina]|uniref:HNH endonuclease n=1 Tax=Solimonas marina TaxID=2714601 RepID=A0A969WDF5_9GAMM|nr:HNH endonuclease signature motif containing protein [Solimonas marina]NKF24509.1 HNH endonuclease [Solimonas marina]
MVGRLLVSQFRTCISEPVPQILDAARYLDAAVTAHLQGKRGLAEELIRAADMPEIYSWLKPIWAKSEAHLVAPLKHGQLAVPKELRVKARMPTTEEKLKIHQRDGYSCRFCGMPVIRPEVRVGMARTYPATVRWGRREAEQHSAFQAMWAQYDHVVPHAKGGTNDLENIVLACAACNFGRGGYSLEEVGVSDPRERSASRGSWDGLERFLRG